MKYATEMTMDKIRKYRESFENNKTAKVLGNAISKSGVDAIAFNNDVLRKMQYNFSIEIETGKVTNQKASGRCWIFAGLNTLRFHIGKKYNIKDFELSQNFVAFWDKFEKANYFLESMIDTLDQEVGSREIMWLIQNMVSDGGQWDMFCNIVEKYGIIPKGAMPETTPSSNSAEMNKFLHIKLREFAAKLRNMYQKGALVNDLSIEKDEMMAEIFKILCMFLGRPPVKFDFEYKDKDKKFFADRDLDPKEFYKKYVDFNIRDYVSLINAPTADKPLWKTYTVKYLGNVVGGKDVKYLNVDIETMKDTAIRQMKDDVPVWFGCDVGKMFYRDQGILDIEAYDYGSALDTEFVSDKAFRLDYYMSCMTHAMVFTGVNIVNDKANRWKVENSWGEDRGYKGFLIMSDEWFNQYMYQVVIHKKYLDKKTLAALDQDPIVLKPWDPMGSLA